MARVEFVTHQGKRILLIDLSNIKPEEGHPIIAEAKKIIATQAPMSVLTMTDVTNAHYDMSLVQSLKELTQHNKPYVKAAAVVGIEGMMKVILTGVEKFSGRKFSIFGNRNEAKDWLVKQ